MQNKLRHFKTTSTSDDVIVSAAGGALLGNLIAPGVGGLVGGAVVGAIVGRQSGWVSKNKTKPAKSKTKK